METKHEQIYALGDVVSIPLKLGKPLPKAGVFAHAEAEVVAKNIARGITRKGKPAAFDGERNASSSPATARPCLARAPM